MTNETSGTIEHNSCRVCGKKDLEPILYLGDQYVVNFVDSSDQKTNKVPLYLDLCNKKDGGCGLLQLRHTVPGDLLYRNFWYKSGVNQTMRNALMDISSKAEKIVNLNEGDIVVDIGANDGTLLRSYKSKGLRLVGFEPAKNLVKDAELGTTKIINDFFNFESFKKEFHDEKAKIITSIAMFYDLENPNEFVKDIVHVLHEDGVWIIQMNYLATMLENNAFDNIVHEHLQYYSLNSLKFLIDRHDLEIFDVELNEINGGSIRTYIKHKNSKKYSTSNKVTEILDYEIKKSFNENKPYHDFAKRISDQKDKTSQFIKKEVEEGKTVYVYGASTRGNTLLQYYGLDEKLIGAAADRNPIKWGKKIVGTGISIISEENAREDNPDYFLILPWYFIDEFIQREKNYLKNGGKFIVPLPEFRIIDSDKL
jgi:2-polyprenyl-3-methyl-5-hydroxy-6-metoxy-1,4-benzoquinol methylase